MKKIIVLFTFLLLFSLSFCDSKNLSNNLTTSSKTNSEIVLTLQKENKILKNQLKEYELLKEELIKNKKRIKSIEETYNLGAVYNIDQIYSNANSFYSVAFKHLLWLIGGFFTVIITLIGYIQFRNETKLEQEKENIITVAKESISNTISSDLLKQKNEYDKLNHAFLDKLNKLQLEILIVEFNRDLSQALITSYVSKNYSQLLKILEDLPTKYCDVPKLELSNLFYHLAIAYGEKKNIEKAMEFYSKAIEFNPTHHEAINNYGVLLIKKSRFSDAIEFFKKNFHISKYQDISSLNLAESYIFLDDFNEGIKYLNLINDSYPEKIDLTQELFDKFCQYVNSLPSYKISNNLKNKILNKQIINII